MFLFSFSCGSIIRNANHLIVVTPYNPHVMSTGEQH
jgi:hypothetical protein